MNCEIYITCMFILIHLTGLTRVLDFFCGGSIETDWVDGRHKDLEERRRDNNGSFSRRSASNDSHLIKDGEFDEEAGSDDGLLTRKEIRVIKA